MELQINGTAMTFEKDSLTISEIVAQLDLGAAPVLVEQNGEAVLARELDTRAVADGDRLEVIRMVAGG